MTFLNLLKKVNITPQTGDVVSLHKGSLSVLPKAKPSSLKAALKLAIKRRELDIKLKLLPDVSGFYIKTSQVNPLLLAHGISTRFGSQKILIKGRNRNINRYLCYTLLRMHKAKMAGNPQLYWTIAMGLIVRSHAYLISTMHFLDRNLYRTRSKGSLLFMLTSLNKMRGLTGKALSDFRRNLQRGFLSRPAFVSMLRHTRVYLPKGKTYRPLGVPSFNWRVFTSMWLTPLNGFITIGEYQQGFIPRRGTLSSWRRMLSLVLEARNIYEVDFKGFFPSVNPSLVSLSLHSKGMPKVLTDYLLDMGQSFPVRESLDPKKLDESVSIARAELDALNLLQGLGPFSERKVGSFGKLDEGFRWANPSNKLEGVLPPEWLWGGAYKEIKISNIVTPPKAKVEEVEGTTIEYFQGNPIFLSSDKNKDTTVELFQLLDNGDFNKIVNWVEENISHVLLSSLLERFNTERYFFASSTKDRLKYLYHYTGSLENLMKTLNFLDQTDIIKEILTRNSIKTSPPVQEKPYVSHMELFKLPTGYKGELLKKYFNLIETEGIYAPSLKGSLDMLGYKPEDLLNPNLIWSTLYEVFQIDTAIEESMAPSKKGSPAFTSLPKLEGPLSPEETIHPELVSKPGQDAGYKIIPEKFRHGLPQGSPLSPFLSIILLDYAYQEIKHRYPNVHWNFYADDGLFYSDDDLEFSRFLSELSIILDKFGIIVHPEKSQVARLQGIWLVSRIKFLGIVYEPATGKLYSETRSGRSLMYTFGGLTSQGIALESLTNALPGIVRYYLSLITSPEKRPELAYLASLGLINRVPMKDRYSKSRYRRFASAGITKLLSASARENLTGLPRRSMYFLIRFAKGILQNTKLLPNLLTPEQPLKEAFNSVFGGLIQSRMYQGNKSVGGFKTPSGSQVFTLSSVKGEKDKYNGSLGQVIQTKLGETMTIRNGSSYATHELILLSQFSCGQRKVHKVLSKGPVTRNLERAVLGDLNFAEFNSSSGASNQLKFINKVYKPRVEGAKVYKAEPKFTNFRSNFVQPWHSAQFKS